MKLNSMLKLAIVIAFGSTLNSTLALADDFDVIMKNSSKSDKIEESKKLGEEISKKLLDAYDHQQTEDMVNTAKQARDSADQIADETIQKERDKALDFLGINPKSDSGVYIFLSWSMPLNTMRSYAIEAMWSGATIVFRGVPPNKDLGEFIVNDLRQLVYDKGAAATISIDPRLFDVYNVELVPSIVFTTVRSNMQCQGIAPVAVVSPNGARGTYDTCPKLDPSKYDKITGAVTLGYALEQFKDSGREGVSPHLTALSKGWEMGYSVSKSQTPFEGKWEDVLSPSNALKSNKP